MSDFSEFIRIIGRGQKAGQCLTQAQASEAMQLICRQQVSPEQLGAFLMLLRVREETPQELAGFLSALTDFNPPELRLKGIDLDIGCYAGKRRHLPWFLLAALTLAQNGQRVFLHGCAEPESQRLYLPEVLSELGLPVCTDMQQLDVQLDSVGLAYMDLADINSPLHRLIQLRPLFGLRSCANTLAKMLNPSAAKFNLQGVFHRHLDDKHSQCASQLFHSEQTPLSEQHMLCFRGEGGEPEYNPERETALFFVRNGQQYQQVIAPMTDSRSFKSIQYGASYLVDIWHGRKQDDYAEQAVSGSLALMLMLTHGHEQLNWAEAVAKAQALWRQRHAVKHTLAQAC